MAPVPGAPACASPPLLQAAAVAAINKQRKRLRAIVMVCFTALAERRVRAEGSESGSGNNYYMTGLIVFRIQEGANLHSDGLGVEWFLEELGPSHVLFLQERPSVPRHE